jgi:predicted metal-dependent HD superfamily phosphohydrolase
MKTPGIEVIAGELETPRLSGDRLLQHIDALKALHDEPGRKHHNFEHPLSLFGELVRFRDEVESPLLVGWTILYHDAIYDPRADPGINEELSARLAELETPFFLSAGGVRKVAAYTRATAEHDAAEPDRDLDFFLDADLAILGSPPERYREYARDIREEYRHVPPELYVPGRIGILEGLATRFENRGVYTTEPFREAYEMQAQANIGAEIEQLSTTA